MAVDQKRIKDRLKALYPKANLSNERLDAIAAKLAQKPADDADDSAVDQIINDYNDVMDFVAIAKQDDRLRTLESKNKDPKEDTKPNPENNDPKPSDDVPTWAQTLIDSNKKLSSELEAIKEGKVIDGKKNQVADLFKNSDVLKGLKSEHLTKWINRVDVNSETSLEDQVKELETEYSEITQYQADSARHASAPAFGKNSSQPDDKMVDDVVDNL